jgi:hypothetical protein
MEQHSLRGQQLFGIFISSIKLGMQLLLIMISWLYSIHLPYEFFMYVSIYAIFFNITPIQYANLPITNSIEQGISWEANSHSATQDIPSYEWNSK